MITKEEFLNALDLVNRYKIQMETEIKFVEKQIQDNRLNNVGITKDTLIPDINMSVRTLNILRFGVAYIPRFSHLKQGSRFEFDIKISELESLTKTEILGLRNSGKKTLEEIQNIFLQVGFDLKD